MLVKCNDCGRLRDDLLTLRDCPHAPRYETEERREIARRVNRGERMDTVIAEVNNRVANG